MPAIIESLIRNIQNRLSEICLLLILENVRETRLHIQLICPYYYLQKACLPQGENKDLARFLTISWGVNRNLAEIQRARLCVFLKH